MKSEPRAYEYWIQDFVENLKSKTKVSISDLEEFYKCAFNIIRTIEQLRLSRDKWRIRAEKAEKKNKGGVSC